MAQDFLERDGAVAAKIDCECLRDGGARTAKFTLSAGRARGRGRIVARRTQPCAAAWRLAARADQRM